MHLRHPAAGAAASAAFLSLLLLLPSTTAFNITQILSKYPEFSTFNHYLSATHLAPEINHHQTITVCVVDNSGMAGLLSKHLDLGAIRNVLSLHILLDYFDAKKLHLITNGTATTATVFQSTGSAPGSSGFITITDLKGGKVGFSADGAATSSATFVKSVEEVPYNFSVIQISTILPSPEAEAPAPSPAEVNLTAAMSAHCKVFTDTLLSIPAAAQTFSDNIESGLTVFCPGDAAMKSFLPEFKNLTGDGKQSLLEYHGMPIYETLTGLRSSNGVTNTLATDGAMKFSFTVQNDGNDVTIKTPIVTAKVVSTVVEKSPVAIFELNMVLKPRELFESLLPPSPAPAPAPKVHARAPKSPPAPAGPEESPADGPVGDTADQKSDGGVGGGARFSVVILSLWFVFLHL